ncbi:MAG: sodium:solute symporter [Bacteroidaceae bacterium]|nr:sodium:solute symporter [Bacteroidaceae bacterium]
MNSITFGTLDWVILLTYFVALLVIGIWASARKKKEENLFLANHSLKWYQIGFSMWGTNVGPSMLIASASAGFATGIVSGNYAWYAFIFIGLLAFVFAPRYLGEKISTLPEFMGKRFGQSTRNMLAWYTIVTIMISWLALTLFAGGILIRQVFGIPMWASALILLAISAFFTVLGGLKAVAYTNVFQMVLLIVVSAALTIVGICYLGHNSFIGGIKTLADPDVIPSHYWNLWLPNDHPDYPWLPILLGYIVSGMWFWCTDQSMVQPVLAAKNLKEGQKGANFTGWLKILDVAIYIVPGIVCFALVRTGFFGDMQVEQDNAYMTLVTNLFPIGMVGLVMAVLTASLVSTISSALNALSTVFTMDIYVKKFNPKANTKEIIKVGRIVTIIGVLISIVITIAIDNIKGMDLFNVFQSVLSFIAPPMAAVFLMGVFWKRCTTMAANLALTLGTVFSIGIGIVYLWVVNGNQYIHFGMLSFIIFCILILMMTIVSLFGKDEKKRAMKKIQSRNSIAVRLLWILLVAVMVGFYIFFNGF